MSTHSAAAAARFEQQAEIAAFDQSVTTSSVITSRRFNLYGLKILNHRDVGCAASRLHKDKADPRHFMSGV